MNADLNKANQEHKDLDNRSYLIGFEDGEREWKKKIGELKDTMETGNYEGNIIDLINKLLK